MTNYLSDQQYLAIKVESTENVPVKPDIFIPLISEDVKSNLNRSPDSRMSGLIWKGDNLLKGRHTHEGTIEVYADPDTLGHIFNMLYQKSSTTGDANSGYTHSFVPGSPDSYTIEIAKGLYAQRYWGVKADSVKLEFDNNKLKATIDIKAVGQFSVATLANDLSGAVTSAVLSQDYVLKPTEGLAVGDVVVIGGVEVTLTGIGDDGVTIEFSETNITASAGDPVYLKRQTYSDEGLRDPFLEGNTLIGLGSDITAAETAASSIDTATAMEGFTITLKNNLYQQPASGKHDPIKLLPRVREGQIETKKLFDGVEQYQKWLDNTQQALVLISKGTFIKSDRTTWEQLKMKFYNVKLNPNSNPLEVGEYIYDEQTFEVLYNRTEGKAVEIELVNRTSGDNY